MSDRRRGGSGRDTPLRRAVGACGAVTTFLALGLCSPAGAPTAHADLDDLLDPIINAATAGIDQVDGLFPVLSPEDLGALDLGSFGDPLSQLDQLPLNFSGQLADALHGSGVDDPLPDSAAAEPAADGATGLGDHDTDAAGTGGSEVGHTGETNLGDNQSNSAAGTSGDSNSSAPKISAPSIPKVSGPGGGGGSGGSGNGGGGKPKANSSATQPAPGQ